MVDADSGEIGGSRSQEFHVIADSGEDAIAYSADDNYASNIETAATVPPSDPAPAPTAELQSVDTPDTGRPSPGYARPLASRQSVA